MMRLEVLTARKGSHKNGYTALQERSLIVINKFSREF